MTNYTPSSKIGGHYVIKDVPNGDYVTNISKTGERTIKKSISVKSADIDVHFDIDNTGDGILDSTFYEIDVTIKKQDGTLINGKLAIEENEYNIVNGKITLSNLNKQTYHAIVKYNGVNYYHDITIDGKPKSITLKNDTETKIITIKDHNGIVIPNVRECILYNDSSDTVYPININSAGISKVNNIPNGTYRVAFLYPEFGYYNENATTIILTDSLTYNIQINLSEYTEFKSQSFDVTIDGTPMPRGRIVLSNDKYHIASEQGVSGVFSFDSLPVEQFTVSYIDVDEKCYTYGTKITPNGETMALSFSTSVDHTITVEDSNGALVNNALVMIKKDSFEYLAISKNGIAKFKCLETGDYSISVIQEPEVYNEFYSVNVGSISIVSGTSSSKTVTLSETYHYLVVKSSGNYGKYPTIDIKQSGVLLKTLKGYRNGIIDCGLWKSGTYDIIMKSFDETVTNSQTVILNDDKEVTIALNK